MTRLAPLPLTSLGVREVSLAQPEEAEGLTDGANDVVVVEQTDGTLRATEFHVQARNKK